MCGHAVEVQAVCVGVPRGLCGRGSDIAVVWLGVHARSCIGDSESVVSCASSNACGGGGVEGWLGL